MNDKVLEAFLPNFSCIQIYPQIKRKLEEHYISHEEFIEWLEDKASRIADGKERTIIHQKSVDTITERACPKCGELLFIDPVNCCGGTQIGGDWQSMWQCKNCEWEELSEKSVEEERALYEKTVTVEKTRRAKKKKKSRIIRPDQHRMLYYRDPRRRRR